MVIDTQRILNKQKLIFLQLIDGGGEKYFEELKISGNFKPSDQEKLCSDINWVRRWYKADGEVLKVLFHGFIFAFISDYKNHT